MILTFWEVLTLRNLNQFFIKFKNLNYRSYLAAPGLPIFGNIDVGDRFGHFGRQHPLSFYVSAEHQQLKYAKKIEILSPTLSHQHHCHPFSHLNISYRYHTLALPDGFSGGT